MDGNFIKSNIIIYNLAKFKSNFNLSKYLYKSKIFFIPIKSGHISKVQEMCIPLLICYYIDLK